MKKLVLYLILIHAHGVRRALVHCFTAPYLQATPRCFSICTARVLSTHHVRNIHKEQAGGTQTKTQNLSLFAHEPNGRGKGASMTGVTSPAANGDTDANADESTAKSGIPVGMNIPPSVYDIDPLPEESQTSIFNFEMKFYDYARSTRLVQGRSYARSTAFQKENIHELPNIQDLSSPKESNISSDRWWGTSAYRYAISILAFFAFPPLVQFLSTQETIPLSLFGDLTDNFSTGVSILYGTLISLTLNILYERQKCITDQIATESSLLVILTRNALTLFQNDEKNKLIMGECISDQVRILVSESRGKELMTMIYADPYGRILDAINSLQGDWGEHGHLIGSTRDIIKDIVKSRSARLAGESSGLPPTHFFILTLLTVIILLNYTLSTLPFLAENGEPSFESRLFFALFTTLYVLFYNFASDLDNPFGGVYQIRRSAIAANLLQTKVLLVNEPLLKDRLSFEKEETSM